MILKELQRAPKRGAWEQAGHRAETQMAHYLKRFFEDSLDIVVLNDVRLMCEGELAQVDHLVVHPAGLIIVESKSVADEIRIDSRLQWTRIFNGREQGIRSPLIQSEMQGLLLMKHLKAFANPGWADIPLEIIVAVSDQGLIKYPSERGLQNVLKADQVPAHIRNAATRGLACFASLREQIQLSAYLTLADEVADELIRLRSDPATTPNPTREDAQFMHEVFCEDLSGPEIVNRCEKMLYGAVYDAALQFEVPDGSGA